MADPDILTISRSGDLLLSVRHDGDDTVFSYRVEAKRLQNASQYFHVLLGERFSEGANVVARHRELLQQYETLDEVPARELPRIEIVDIGRISRVSTIKNITADFLLVLHGKDLSVTNPPLANVANLAIVADRFDSLPILSAHLKRKGVFQKLEAKRSLEEEKIRQKILVGALLDWAPWFTAYSKRLILHGSRRWEPSSEDDPSLALWWDLPYGVEEELRYRRESVLQTIGSIQSYFLKLYTSGDRQCKLGYDSSLACDSFQLGEMVKFLTRIGTLRLQSAVLETEEPPQFRGDIERLVENLRRCPEYQIDSNHAHCGLRTRLIPLLDWMQFWLDKDGGSLDVGLCAECWKSRRAEYAWLDAKRPLIWRRSAAPAKGMEAKEPGRSSHKHFETREMFTAVDRSWG